MATATVNNFRRLTGVPWRTGAPGCDLLERVEAPGCVELPALACAPPGVDSVECVDLFERLDMAYPFLLPNPSRSGHSGHRVSSAKFGRIPVRQLAGAAEARVRAATSEALPCGAFSHVAPPGSKRAGRWSISPTAVIGGQAAADARSAVRSKRTAAVPGVPAARRRLWIGSVRKRDGGVGRALPTPHPRHVILRRNTQTTPRPTPLKTAAAGAGMVGLSKPLSGSSTHTQSQAVLS